MNKRKILGTFFLIIGLVLSLRNITFTGFVISDLYKNNYFLLPLFFTFLGFILLFFKTIFSARNNRLCP